MNEEELGNSTDHFNPKNTLPGQFGPSGQFVPSEQPGQTQTQQIVVQAVLTVPGIVEAFNKDAFLKALTADTKIDPANVRITGVTLGSVVVTTEIMAHDTSSASNIVSSITTATLSSTSALRLQAGGAITATTIVSTRAPPTPHEPYRTHHPLVHLFKTKMCRTVLSGQECEFQRTCRYAHTEDELRTVSDNKTNPKPVVYVPVLQHPEQRPVQVMYMPMMIPNQGATYFYPSPQSSYPQPMMMQQPTGHHPMMMHPVWIPAAASPATDVDTD